MDQETGRKLTLYELLDRVLYWTICLLTAYWIVLSFIPGGITELGVVSAVPGAAVLILAAWARKSRKGAVAILLFGLIVLAIAATRNIGASLAGVSHMAGPVLMISYGALKMFSPHPESIRGGDITGS